MTTDPITTAVAIVGVGAILPDAPDAATYWANVRGGRYSITDVDPARWDPAFYYDPNPKAPDKTYSKIGGWVRDWAWEPLAWKLPIPPCVGDVHRRCPEVGSGLHPSGVARLRLARSADRRRTYRRRARQRDVGRAPLPHRIAHCVSRARVRARPCPVVPSAAVRRPQDDQRRVRRAAGRPLSGDHRGHHARGARQLHGRSGGEPVRLPRTQLRGRRRLRVGPRGDRLVPGRPPRRTSTTR